MEVKTKNLILLLKKSIQKGKGGTQREDQHTKPRQCLKVKGGKGICRNPNSKPRSNFNGDNYLLQYV
jgi:hypothetical protein